MNAKIIDGKAIAADIRAQISKRIADRLAANLRRPGLAVILVGSDPASEIYVRNKRRACEEAGLLSKSWDLPADTPEAELLALIDELNQNSDIDGILVQLPYQIISTPNKLSSRYSRIKMWMVFILTTSADSPCDRPYYALAHHVVLLLCSNILVRHFTEEKPL